MTESLTLVFVVVIVVVIVNVDGDGDVNVAGSLDVNRQDARNAGETKGSE